jgi:hypothetical protein
MLDTVQPGGKELTFDFDDWKREDIERVLEIVAYRGLHGAFDGRFLLVRDLTGIEAAPCANSSTT